MILVEGLELRNYKALEHVDLRGFGLPPENRSTFNARLL